jgi:outer membrane protein assembly factor BamB
MLVPGGASQQISVTVTPVNGFTGSVTLAITGLPTGVTAQPATLTLPVGSAQTVTITAALAAAAGSPTISFSGTSGALAHTATVTATIAPPPDYTLTISPPVLTITAGGAGVPVSVKANAVNSFSGTVLVSISGLLGGISANPASLSLTPGTAQTTTLTAAAGTPAATPTVLFTGNSGSLTHTAALSLTVQTAPVAAIPDVTTYHYDLARDGLNSQETILTQANVNSTQFGKIGFDTVDGKVDAEPLYLANLTIAGQAHNVLYVATEHGSVYAFDADTGTKLWMTSVIPTGEMTSDDHNCTQITTEIGITSTPVIDRKQGANGTLFTVGMSKDAAGTYHQRLHALDITTGAEISGSPTEVTASVPGTGDNSQAGNVVFNPSQYAERAALLLLNGNVYTGWTSHCDVGLYTGWVMAYSETTLQQTQLLNLTPNGHMGSIWMSGNGLSADSSGNIYLLQANGTFDTTLDANGFPVSGDYGNAMLRLTANGKLAVADYFESFNTVSESGQDLDLGSGGAVLLPDQTDANGAVHRLIVGAGKDKNIYLADRTNLGKFNPSTNPMDANIYQKITGQLAGLNYTTPAYFNNVLYYGADGDTLKAFPLTNAKMATTPSSRSVATFAHPGTTPAVSANGTQNGIVWAVESALANPAVLHAYDPTNLAHEFYNSNQAANGRDGFGNGNKFITPLVINGKVYVGTQTGVAVFGLLSH